MLIRIPLELELQSNVIIEYDLIGNRQGLFLVGMTKKKQKTITGTPLSKVPDPLLVRVLMILFPEWLGIMKG